MCGVEWSGTDLAGGGSHRGRAARSSPPPSQGIYIYIYIFIYLFICFADVSRMGGVGVAILQSGTCGRLSAAAFRRRLRGVRLAEWPGWPCESTGLFFMALQPYPQDDIAECQMFCGRQASNPRLLTHLLGARPRHAARLRSSHLSHETGLHGNVQRFVLSRRGLRGTSRGPAAHGPVHRKPGFSVQGVFTGA